LGTTGATGANANANTNTNKDDVVPVVVVPRYHELQDQITERARNFSHHSKAFIRRHPGYEHISGTSHEMATEVTDATWFHPQKICTQQCCAQSVAISMDHENRRIINTIDGLDLADIIIEYNMLPVQAHHDFAGQKFNFNMLPCLQPGTVFFSANYGPPVSFFWQNVRPKITVPFIFITSESDIWSPSQPEWLDDPLLIRWYGMNPTYGGTHGKRHDKFRFIHLGLSRMHPQEKYLLPYLELTGFSNPFLDKSRWTKSAITERGVDFDDDVFVLFGRNDMKMHRVHLWESLCSNTTSSSISCGGNSESKDPHEVYSIASNYSYGISPPGVGWDCYRTYEYLLLGMIPIIERLPHNESYDVFEGFPTVQMEGFWSGQSSDVTKQGIVSAIERYISSPDFLNATFSGWERLFLGYWRREILKDAGRYHEIIQDDRGDSYYQGWTYLPYNPPFNFEPDAVS
jgi:hypothetical protein